MGWSSGSSLMSKLITSMKNNKVEFHTRVKVYKDMINAFEDKDCDTLMECLGEDFAFDESYKTFYPDYFEDE